MIPVNSVRSIKDKFRDLPVAEVAEDVNASLAAHPRLVLTAPPGAGKSTLLPLSILENLPEGKIIMLEPRRLAARQVASRMADMLGEQTGLTVGYRVRFDTRVSASTRIEVVTEGVMERMLIDDPALEGVAVVIFDEFHERSLASDLSLALVREIQGILRPDLKILVMSATIDASSIAGSLDAKYLHCQGKIHDVKIIYGEDMDVWECAEKSSRCVRKALRENEGDILVFLPGQAEIMKCRDLLTDCGEPAEILTLYGNMPPDAQMKVLRPNASGVRRVILATPIAETSLTIEGISTVIDSGLCRMPVFDPSTGLSRLVISRISLDMAVQRSGRAGRLGPGMAYRLWSKAAESRMKASRVPEILSGDLSPMMLSIAAWGENDPLRLPWLTSPSAGRLAQTGRMLQMLEAMDSSGRLTEKGRRISGIPCHPRIASMLTDASAEVRSLACEVAALLEEKDPLNDPRDADLTTRILTLHELRRRGLPSGWKKIDEIARQYAGLINAPRKDHEVTPETIGRLIASAYPERIAMRDSNGKYRLASGNEIVTLDPADDLARHEFVAVASMGARIFLAAPLDREDVTTMGRWTECASWSSREGRAIAREELRYGNLTLATRPLKGDSRGKVIEAIAAAAPKEGLTMFDFNDDVADLQLRIQTASKWHPELEFPDVSTDTLLGCVSEWLPMYAGQGSGVQDLRKIDMRNVILGRLAYEQQKRLDEIAPPRLTLPSGRNVRIRYRKGSETPVVSARIQDCFGLRKTPHVDDGRQPVLMELLSPGFKPVQLTQDMEGFWKSTYFEVRKELRRRYPKHKWPDDPAGG